MQQLLLMTLFFPALLAATPLHSGHAQHGHPSSSSSFRRSAVEDAGSQRFLTDEVLRRALGIIMKEQQRQQPRRAAQTSGGDDDVWLSPSSSSSQDYYFDSTSGEGRRVRGLQDRQQYYEDDDDGVRLLRPPMAKRYLGIDIPDYISSGGKSDAIKSMSEKMKALGKKRR